MCHKVHTKIEEQKYPEIYINRGLRKIKTEGSIVTGDWKLDKVGC